MKRLALLSLLFVAACNQLPTETASRAPSDSLREGGVLMGGGLHTLPTCKNDDGETVPCP